MKTRRDAWKDCARWVEAGAHTDRDVAPLGEIASYLLSEARVFRMPTGADIQAMRKDLDDGTIESLSPGFLLPFPVIAVESWHESIVCLTKVAGNDWVALEGDPEPGLIGTWLGMTVMSTESGDTAVTFGAITHHETDRMEYRFAGALGIHKGEARVVADLERDYGHVTDRVLKHLKLASEHTIGYAMAVMMAVQRPKNWIVEEAPVSPLRGKRAKRSKCAPLSARPVYVSLSTEGVRRIYGLKRPSGSRVGHERRAHMKTLRADRFTYMKGKTVPVKASWVGPSSGKTADGREYRVRLDIKSPEVK